VLMYRYTSQKDIIIGTPVAGREHADLEDQIGFYVNTLALRNSTNPEESFDSFYNRVKEDTLKSYNHQMYPFDRLVEELNLQRDTSRSPVFDVMLILQNKGERMAGIELSAGEINQIADLGYCTSKFDIEICFQENENCLSFNVAFNTDIYEKSMVERLIRHYKQLLNALLENPEEKIITIDYLSNEEKQKLLFTFNDTAVSYPQDTTIVDLFEQQVARTPNNIAVVFEDKEMTYQELNERSNQVAHYLKDNYDIQSGDLVGIHLDRSEWMIVSILGVLKSGGAYVPIDPEFPQERIDYIISDSGCNIVINNDLVNKISGSEENKLPEINTTVHKKNGYCAVVYTSGSTGRPKGIIISGANLLNRLYWMWGEFPFGAQEICAAKTSIGFVDHLWEIFGPLLKGIRLVVFSKEAILDTPNFIDQLSKHGISRQVLVPSLLRQILSFEKLCI